MCAIFIKSEMSDSKNDCAAMMEVNQYKGALETKQRDIGKTSKTSDQQINSISQIKL